MRGVLKVVALSVVVSTVAACGMLGDSGPTPSASASTDPIAGLTLEQQVGQLFMVGTPATHLADTAYRALRDRDVGGVFLSGRSAAGVADTASVVRSVRAAAGTDSTVPLFVATDQEGGQVQVLSGDGFSTIPSALEQGALPASQLQAAAEQWGSELAKAGVNLDLAPVADIVLTAASANEPIAQLQREYGFSAKTVDPAVTAFVAGMRSAGVRSTLKHFPGLGYVIGNTDTQSGVTDTVTSATGPTVASFGALMSTAANPAGAHVVMVSSAIYRRIDPATPAVFSKKVVTGLLRTTLGFDGIVISDDLSAATQVTAVKPGDRAIRAIEAGVDIVLVSRAPEVAASMMDAVLAKAKADPAFAARVAAAARTVIEQKRAQGI